MRLGGSMKKIVLGLVMTVLLVTGCENDIESPSIEGNSQVEGTDAEKFKKEYEAYNGTSDTSINLNIDTNNPIKYVSKSEVVKILEEDTAIVYIGFASCPWCRNMLPVLFDVVRENNLDTVYYFNPSDIRGSNDDDYLKIMDLLSDYLSRDTETGETKLYVPDVYFVKSGEIVGNNLGTVNSQESPYVALTDDQTKELKEIYQNLIDKMLGD